MVMYCCAFKCGEKSGRSKFSFHSFPKDEKLRKEWVIAMKMDRFTPKQHSKLCGKHFSAEAFNTSAWSSMKVLKPDAVPSIFDIPENLTKCIPPRKPAKCRSTSASTPPPRGILRPAVIEKIPEAFYRIDLITGSGENIECQPDVHVLTGCSPARYSSSPITTLTGTQMMHVMGRPSNSTTNIMTHDDGGVNLKCDPAVHVPAESSPIGDFRKKKRKSYLGDFNIEDLSSPIKAAKYMAQTRKLLKKKTIKIKSMLRKEGRLKKRIHDLQSLVKHLKSQQLVRNEAP